MTVKLEGLCAYTFLVMKTLPMAPNPSTKKKAEIPRFLYELLVWGFRVVSS
jgi:hypothetical protein